MKHHSSTIHWAENREVSINESFRILTSIPSKKPDPDSSLYLTSLKRFNDTTLAPNRRIEIQKAGICFVLPLVGGLELLEQNIFVEPGDFFLQKINFGDSLSIQNPYETEHINFLELYLDDDIFDVEKNKGSFNLDQNLNELVELDLSSSKKSKIFIGKFTSRKEYCLTFEKDFNAYMFVISGSFEANGMLLHARDSASFTQTEAIDFESLSEESMVIIIVQ
jgi:quercetin 2,3-dioxygenase